EGDPVGHMRQAGHDPERVVVAYRHLTPPQAVGQLEDIVGIGHGFGTLDSSAWTSCGRPTSASRTFPATRSRPTTWRSTTPTPARGLDGRVRGRPRPSGCRAGRPGLGWADRPPVGGGGP